MVELLLKNVSDVHPDPLTDRTTSLKRGDLVFAKQIPHDDWNEYETLPEFSRLIISDLNISGIISYMNPWYLELGYETLDYNSVDDIYTIRMFSNTPGATQLGVLTAVDVIHHLENWNLTVSGFGSNEVIFIADMKDVILSRNFWNGITNGLVITPVSFNSTTKEHTMKISYSGYAIEKSRIVARGLLENILNMHGISINRESIYGQLMEVIIPSSAIVNEFKTSMEQATRKVVFARRYYLNNTAMNIIQTYMENNNGDAMTVNVATLNNYVEDRITEI